VTTLRARGLTLAVGDRTLARGIELALSPGEIVAVEGPSGSGKSTLLRALSLLDAPAAGEVLLDGEPPSDVPAFRRRVVYVAQRPVALAATVREDLARPFDYKSASAAFDEADALARLTRLGLPDVLDQDPASLSEGERQRVCIARALSVAPDVLLLDEPTSALDPDAIERVEAELRAFVEGGGACLLVSHSAEQRGRLADRRVEPFA
jgi:putative ABC transport system ATP-binding protein